MSLVACVQSSQPVENGKERTNPSKLSFSLHIYTVAACPYTERGGGAGEREKGGKRERKRIKFKTSSFNSILWPQDVAKSNCNGTGHSLCWVGLLGPGRAQRLLLKEQSHQSYEDINPVCNTTDRPGKVCPVIRQRQVWCRLTNVRLELQRAPLGGSLIWY